MAENSAMKDEQTKQFNESCQGLTEDNHVRFGVLHCLKCKSFTRKDHKCTKSAIDRLDMEMAFKNVRKFIQSDADPLLVRRQQEKQALIAICGLSLSDITKSLQNSQSNSKEKGANAKKMDFK